MKNRNNNADKNNRLALLIKFNWFTEFRKYNLKRKTTEEISKVLKSK